MAEHEEKSKKGLYAVIVIILIVIIGIIGYFCLVKNDVIDEVSVSTSSIKNEIITSENYEEISNEVTEEYGDSDETYYFSYAVLYHLTTDGLSNLLSDDEEAMYVNIYGKTVGELINEGKQLMEDNGVTIEEYKENLQEASETE